MCKLNSKLASTTSTDIRMAKNSMPTRDSRQFFLFEAIHLLMNVKYDHIGVTISKYPLEVVKMQHIG